VQTEDQMKRGRPSDYGVEIGETICMRLVNGESLRAICTDPAMPARATVFRWLISNKEFRHSYVLARECQAEDLTDEIREIIDREHVVRSRLRISSRIRGLARMAPRKYGKY
jgi:hypothetical protein